MPATIKNSALAPESDAREGARKNDDPNTRAADATAPEIAAEIESAEIVDFPGESPFVPWTTTGQEAAQAWFESCAAFLDGANGVTAELSQFATRCAESHAKAWQAAARVDGNWEQLLSAPNDFAATMTQAYCEEASKVTQLMADTGRSAWAPFESLMRGR